MSNPLYNDAGCPSACMAGGEYASIGDIYAATPIPASTAVRIVPFQAQTQGGQVLSLPSVASQQAFGKMPQQMPSMMPQQMPAMMPQQMTAMPAPTSAQFIRPMNNFIGRFKPSMGRY